MTKTELNDLTHLAQTSGFRLKQDLLSFLASVVPVEELIAPADKKSTRTDQQRKALEVYCRERAKTLNDAGLTVQEVLAKATELDWTQYRFKELIWKKSLFKLYGKDSTTDMKKTEEIDNIYKHVERFLGEVFHLESMDFPHDPEKQKENMSGYKSSDKSHLDEYYKETDVKTLL